MATGSFESKYGPWALVTGAARGLGAEFARQVASLGLNVVMVDVLADEQAQVAQEIRSSTDREIKTVVTDLSTEGFMEHIRRETDGLEIGLLICNAATSSVEPFFDVELEAKLEVIAVNVRSPLILVHEFGPEMRKRGRGGIILLSSGAALQGTAPAVRLLQ